MASRRGNLIRAQQEEEEEEEKLTQSGWQSGRVSQAFFPRFAPWVNFSLGDQYHCLPRWCSRSAAMRTLWSHFSYDMAFLSLHIRVELWTRMSVIIVREFTEAV